MTLSGFRLYRILVEYPARCCGICGQKCWSWVYWKDGDMKL